jgi:transcriptional regulator with XRE-family HTH domain
MPRKPTLTTLYENRSKVAELIREGLRVSGLPKAVVAERAGVHPSHLSKLINKSKSLSREKLLALADVLQISRAAILEAAGYTSAELESVLSNLTLLPKAGGTPLKVITDPKFPDSAFWMWVFGRQPFRPIGIECELVKTHWRLIPAEVAKEPYAIAFYNRRAAVRSGDRKLYKVQYWTDLSLYRGYAVLASRKAELKAPIPFNKAGEYLRELARKKPKPVLVCIGADTAWILTRSFVHGLNIQDFEIEFFADADDALRQFVENDLGDLFIGGLPQRLQAVKNGCAEVLTFANNPLLFSINSLICSEEMFRTSKPILSAATSIWFQAISELTLNDKDETFRNKIVNAILQMVDNLGVTDASLSAEVLRQVLPPKTLYEIFPAQPTDLVDEVLTISEQVFTFWEKELKPNYDRKHVMSQLQETFKAEVDKSILPASF